jgi:PelA/Pel-15E family pectate lyase
VSQKLSDRCTIAGMKMLLLSVVVLLPLHASVIGVSKPAESLTRERAMTLAASQRGPWLEYLAKSQQQMQADKAELATERLGLQEIPAMPRQGNSARSIPVDRGAAYYKSDEARHIADVILSFQTPAGGWSKNLDMDGPERLRGQSYTTANLAPVESGAGDFDAPADPNWHYVGTLDNDATNTELHFLAAMSAAWPGAEGDRYRTSALRGFEYLLRAQYPNGGWPQVWPLEGGYHDAITYNDDAVTESAEVLRLVAAGERGALEDYSFVPAQLRTSAKAAVAKALQCILATQLRVNGVLTVWSQQNDPLTLAPVSARNFEPAALSSGESASVMEYLMALPHPSPEVVRAVEAADTWFEAHKVMGYAWTGGRGTPGGRKLTAAAGAGPLWARYYSIATGKPIFGDRDKTIHDDVMELSLERRNGYGWYGDSPEAALAEYTAWRPNHSLNERATQSIQ